jgi:hypothetical protein
LAPAHFSPYVPERTHLTLVTHGSNRMPKEDLDIDRERITFSGSGQKLLALECTLENAAKFTTASHRGSAEIGATHITLQFKTKAKVANQPKVRKFELHPPEVLSLVDYLQRAGLGRLL